MINAREASELLRSMTPADRLEALKNKVSAKTRAALETKIRETIAAYETKVDIVLSAKICCDADKDIKAFLTGLWYSDVRVTSDFPAYCESYEGTTTISFSIPTL